MEPTYSKKKLLVCEVEEWKLDDKLHNDNAPAKTYTFEDGSKWEFWYKNGARHRIHGPAFVVYGSDGVVIDSECEYYFNDNLLTEDQHKISVFCEEGNEI